MKRLSLLILFLVSIVSVYGQQRKTITNSDRVIVRDSLTLNGENISISGAADNHVLVRENGRWINKNIADLDTLDIGDDQTLAIDSTTGQIGITIENGNRIHFKVGGAVTTDTTLNGLGTVASPLKIDTTIIATKNDIVIAGGYSDLEAQQAIGSILDNNGDFGNIWLSYIPFSPVISGTPVILGVVPDDSHEHVIANVDNLQTTLNGKQATITGAATTVTTSNLAGSSVLISNSSGKIAVSPTISDTELGFLNGVTNTIVDNYVQFTNILDVVRVEQPQTLAYGSTVNFNMNTSINGVLTLTGDVDVLTIENIDDGQSGTLAIVQNDIGGWGINAISSESLIIKYASTDVPIGTFGTPASSTDTGTTGQVKYDGTYLYICTDTDTWKRIAFDSW